MALRLLTIDDDPHMGRLTSRVGQQLNYECQSVTEAKEVLGAVRAFQPTVILLDLQMQGVDGVEWLRQLAAQSCRARICLMSGVDHRVLQTAKRLGEALLLDMGPMLHKPFELDALRRCLELPTEPPAPAVSGLLPTHPITQEELQRAIDGRQMRVRYQPQLALTTQNVVGVEALARWLHPQRAMVSPQAFIGLAESTGLIHPLTDLLLHQICADMVSWPATMNHLQMAVNLSALLLNDITLPDRLAQVVSGYGLPLHRFTWEITESWAVNPGPMSLDILTRLRLKGFQLSIDDLGTGHSSLEQLYALPYSELKIDRQFIDGCTHNSEAALIVQSVIQLGSGLGVSVVAEGIENLETYRFLQRWRGLVGQGYFISPPLTHEDWLAWFAKPYSAA